MRSNDNMQLDLGRSNITLSKFTSKQFMKHYLRYIFSCTIAIIGFLFVSCNENEAEETMNSMNEPTEWDKKLFNTTWLHYKQEHYQNGELTNTNTARKDIFRFSEEKNGNSYKVYYNVIPYISSKDKEGREGIWFTTADKKLCISTILAIPWENNIVELSNSTLIIEYESEPDMDNKNYKFVHYFSRISDTENNSDNSNADAPRIGFYDFTATQKSITVRYEIYNKDEANITSARVYYGTSSNPTSSVGASITGKYITATISGLSKGTEYYVKCKVTGSGGNTTTDVTKCVTNY